MEIKIVVDEPKKCAPQRDLFDVLMSASESSKNSPYTTKLAKRMREVLLNDEEIRVAEYPDFTEAVRKMVLFDAAQREWVD